MLSFYDVLKIVKINPNFTASLAKQKQTA